MSTSPPIQATPRAAGPAALAVALAAALAGAVADLATGLAQGRSYTVDALPLARALATTCLLLLVAQGLLHAGAAAVRRSRPVLPRSLAVATVVGGTFADALRQLAREPWLDLRELALTAAGACVLGLVVAVLFARGTRRSPTGGARAVARGALLLGVLALAGLVGVGSGWMARPPAALGSLRVGSAVVALLAVLAAWRLASPRAAAACLGIVTLLVLASPLLAAAWPTRPPAFDEGASRPRVVILLTIDTLRRDFLSCYDPGAPPTPHLDALARDGVLFEEARSPAPWTLAATGSLLTGVSPAVHGALTRESVLPARLDTLVPHLLAAGYRTAAIGRNAFLKRRSRLDRGFLDYTFYPAEPPAAPVAGKLLARLRPAAYLQNVPDEHLVALARAWLRRHAAEPFFLWLHLMDPHAPYEPPARLVDEALRPPGFGMRFHRAQGLLQDTYSPEQVAWVRALYAGEVRRVDELVGELVTELRDLGLYDEALVVVTSDHGEEFWEHGGFEHGQSLYDELLRVPLFVKRPGNSSTGRVRTPVSTERVAATVLAACGLGFGDSRGARAPALPAEPEGPNAAPSPAREPAFLTGLIYGEPRSASLQDGQKYVRWRSGREELYDLRLDPAERTSLAGAEGAGSETRARFDELVSRLRAQRGELGLEVATEALDARTMEALRAVGYF